VKIRGEKEVGRQITGMGKWECGSGKKKNAEFGKRKVELKSVVQRGENKRNTTEGHGATRKGIVYKFVVSV
jgi:hypothetical protein